MPFAVMFVLFATVTTAFICAVDFGYVWVCRALGFRWWPKINVYKTTTDVYIFGWFLQFRSTPWWGI